MAGVSLTLEYLNPADYMAGTNPMRVTAVSDETGLESDIFVFHSRGDTSPFTEDQFECVASLQQMQELPVDTPVVPEEGSDIVIPYYRKDVVEFIVLSPDEVDGVWQIIKSDVALLIKQHRLFDKIADQETVLINPD